MVRATVANYRQPIMGGVFSGYDLSGFYDEAIGPDDVRLVCWQAIIPADPTPETA